MSYIPDCRTDEFYNDKNLNEKDKEFVRGYDWCTECAADTFFDNLDVFFGDDSHLMHVLNEELPQGLKEKYEFERTYGVDKKTETREVTTYGDLLRVRLLEYIESERDELIISMVDGASDGATSDDIE